MKAVHRPWPADFKGRPTVTVCVNDRDERSLTLPPGKHTLQLVLGDSLHIPHDPPVYSKKITIEVE